MAINPDVAFPGKTAGVSPEYPYGKARDVGAPGDGSGTPLKAAWLNDWFGLQQQLLSLAGIVPSGVADAVGACQVWDALSQLLMTRADLAATTGASLVGRGTSNVDADLSIVENDALQVETAVSTNIRNRSYARMFEIPKSASILPGDPGIMQSFWLDPFNREIWTAWDNSARDRQVIERRAWGGTVISTDVYTGPNSIGHLDGFHVNSDGSIWCADKFTAPSLVRVKAGAILERLTYSVPITSNSILGVDRSFNDRFILTGAETGGPQKIWTGLFSEAISGVLQLEDTGILLPTHVDEPVQGVAVIYDRVFILAGGGDLFKSKFIYEYRLSDASLIAKVPCNPDRLYANQVPSAGAGVIREPEGLNVIFETLNNEQVLNFYVGFCFGDTDLVNASNVVFKAAPPVARTHTPAISAWPGRADGQEETRPVTHYIIFDKKPSGWGVQDGSFDSMLSRQLALNIRPGSPTEKGVVFDLPWSYQCVIGWSITSTSGLLDNNDIYPFWVFNPGGSNSRFNQRINLYQKNTDSYINGDDNSILTGTKICLTLTVIM